MGRFSSQYRVSHEHMALELAEIKNLLLILVRLLLEDGQSKLVTAIHKSSRFKTSPQGEITPPISPPTPLLGPNTTQREAMDFGWLHGKSEQPRFDGLSISTKGESDE